MSGPDSCTFGALDSSPDQMHTRHSPGNVYDTEKLDAPIGLHAVNVENAGAGGAGGNHGVIEDRFDDGPLAFQVEVRPLAAQRPAGARQLVDLTGVRGLGDVTPGLSDAVGDGVTGGNPLPRADRAVGIQAGQLI